MARAFGAANNIHLLSWGGGQTERIPKLLYFDLLAIGLYGREGSDHKSNFEPRNFVCNE